MTDLSPAAQAVFRAYLDNCDGAYEPQWYQGDLNMIAAALRAAADQVVPDEDTMPINLAHRVRWDARQSVRFQLLALAAELDGTTTS